MNGDGVVESFPTNDDPTISDWLIEYYFGVLGSDHSRDMSQDSKFDTE